MSIRREILAKVHAVPPLPEVVFKLQKYCNDPNVSYPELAKVIEVDPGLTTSLLRLANSAYFGCERTIGSVQYAMTRLGLKRVYQMVLAVCVAPMTRKPIRGYDLTPAMLWQHAIATATNCSPCTCLSTPTCGGSRTLSRANRAAPASASLRPRRSSG